MENILKKRLAIIKDRAKQLKETYVAKRVPSSPIDTDPSCTLAEAADGEERTIDASSFYLIRTMGESVAVDAPDLAKRFCELSQQTKWRDFVLPARIRAADTSRVCMESFCFFDIETTGLSPNTYAFLCGMMYIEQERFVVDQAFARDYSEEEGVLRFVAEMFRRFPVLVTFNGASFDVPFVKTRAAVELVELDFPPVHIDLLLPARRYFGKALPNCRLETIERHLRGVEREGDIPGREIPEAYHDFVRTGDAKRIKRILHHNRMDLISMASIIDHLANARP